MTELDDHARPDPPLAADEGTTLLDVLEYQRATLARKGARLDANGLSATIGVSSLTGRPGDEAPGGRFSSYARLAVTPPCA